MSDILEQKILELEAKLKELQGSFEAEISRLTSRIKSCEEDTCDYMLKHVRDHSELEKIVWAAFCKTHPGYIPTLIQADNITGKLSGGTNDPQP